MKLNLSKEEANVLLKAIRTRIKFLKNDLIYLETEKFIKECEGEMTLLNILKIEIRKNLEMTTNN